jgi:pilus assembly protein CpaB
VSVAVRRRRGLVLISLAVACGGLAAAEVGERQREVERRVGPLVPVVVAARELGPDDELGRRVVEVREVPERFVPPDALASVEAVQGLRVAVPVAAGSYLTAGHLQGARGGRGPGRLGRGERAVEVGVTGGAALAGAGAGARVDVVISTEAGARRSFVALEDVELLGLSGAAPDAAVETGDGAAATATATLRVTLGQAVYLAAAENFAREIRLLLRPPGDRSRAGRASVGAGDL